MPFPSFGTYNGHCSIKLCWHYVRPARTLGLKLTFPHSHSTFPNLFLLSTHAVTPTTLLPFFLSCFTLLYLTIPVLLWPCDSLISFGVSMRKFFPSVCPCVPPANRNLTAQVSWAVCRELARPWELHMCCSTFFRIIRTSGLGPIRGPRQLLTEVLQ
jgi:hypothetical protein